MTTIVEALKQTGVIERTPETDALRHDPINDLNDNELRNLVRSQQAELQASQLRVKREDNEFKHEGWSTPKRERTDDSGVGDDDEVSIVKVSRKKQRPDTVEVIEILSD